MCLNVFVHFVWVYILLFYTFFFIIFIIYNSAISNHHHHHHTPMRSRWLSHSFIRPNILKCPNESYTNLYKNRMFIIHIFFLFSIKKESTMKKKIFIIISNKQKYRTKREWTWTETNKQIELDWIFIYFFFRRIIKLMMKTFTDQVYKRSTFLFYPHKHTHKHQSSWWFNFLLLLFLLNHRLFIF